jgi:hypothetical protein
MVKLLAATPPLPRVGVLGRLARRIVAMGPEEASGARRGFHLGTAAKRQRLDEVGATFVLGLNAGLETWSAGDLAPRLERVERELRGFAYEGAAMAYTMLDMLLPWGGGRWARLLAGPGADHAYMLFIGAGWAPARLGRRLPRFVTGADPLFCWLAYDGWGFHDGYFHPERSARRQEVPSRLHGYARRAFDQGLGRSLWFVDGADVERLARTVGAFAAERRPDLWSGVGLAATYAGGAEPDELAFLVRAAGAGRPALAQGSTFAAKARLRAGTMAGHVDIACVALCGLGAEAAAGLLDAAQESLPEGETAEQPAYEMLRQRLQAGLEGRDGGAGAGPDAG